MKGGSGKTVSRRELIAGIGAGAAAGVAASGVTFAGSNPIVIGHQQDMTGFLSFYGYSFDLGARGAVDYINERGGIGGRELEYVVLDTQSEVAAGVRRFRELVEARGADFVLGATHSGINLGTNPVAEELRTITFPQGEASQTTGREANRFIFRLRSPSSIQGRAAVDFALKELGSKWTFVITDYAYGHSFYEELAPLVEARGGEILGVIPVPVQSQDMIPYLAGISRETEVLFAVFTTADGLRYLRQTHELGLSARMARIGPWGMIDGVSLGEISDELEGAYFLSHSPRWLDQVPASTREFVEAARGVIGVDEEGRVVGTDRLIASSYYLAPWHTLHLLKVGIEGSGWMRKNDNLDLIEFLEGFEGKASLEFPMSDFLLRGADHQAFQNIWIEQVIEGKLVVQSEVPMENLFFEPVVDVRQR